MKKLTLILVVIAFALLMLGLYKNHKKEAKTVNFTNVTIMNTSNQDSVKVFVTLQSPNSIIGLFGISDTIGSCSKGYFYAKKDKVYKSNTANSLLGVVVSFVVDNLPCQVAVQQGFLSGINIFEFSVNVPFEVFDISCEDGVNSILKASVSDTLWTTGDGVNIAPFTSAQNKGELIDNINIRGVFPYRCTDCIDTGSAVPQNCFNLLNTCNAFSTCQVARTRHKGGNIILEYKGSF